MNSENQYYDILNVAASSMGLEFNVKKYNQFIEYKDLLKDWNSKVNLTAITEDEEIIKKHFIDSMKIFQFEYLKKANRIIDIGTGGGFPGIPMKIIRPEVKMVLLDSLRKRINVLDDILCKIGIDDVETIHGRAEEFSRNAKYREQFDAVVSRAVANLAALSEFCLPYVKVGGYFVALKGPSVDEEVKIAKKAISILGGKLEEIREVEIENSDLKHNLVIIKKIKNTPKQYPRKAGTAIKKPLL
ncbi:MULTISPECIES: 16S rRNA (guanine(527)-N(7))-methyltransferase RsmG [Clostridium]|uniref:Ribosomal RNA small subunit methyltransferase G n=1 Tax=Clostridium haemolyticum NCTC 9693 TaxID=1443114 RepID=A0ABR4TCK6_CLOHA|nr:MULTISPECIES: 16S rRNA (guanine(527)-N(7))-methyltransferase RsmG [Clostridium]KEI11531.1 16S rRNA methyltransferase [Clostridium novyi B str. NCTC 9691]KEI15564.1 16S rRNA methyltransferase [Clostridium haemolyticum NCTC 9693]KGN02102.1 16S rRNA methyltransferase [Clostridium haemolyticum NCTC 8350]OOB75632.1 16S rRNA (guanine(527)-N(7))-methyltransferase RsmG [Clostridium haemolyticum]CAG7838951.1 Ribosomal RNA small subunit methyltransferase G [Clostridium haemolyticum]